MQDLMLVLSSVLILSVGFLEPFIMTLGYVWVDIFTPQLVSNGILSTLPVALIFGAAAVATYLLRDRKDPPKMNAITVLILALTAWMTLSLLWSGQPDPAYFRWSVAIKVALFAAFVPYSIRTRVQIEALILVYLVSIAGHVIPWGLKTFITGGGYGLSLGLLRSNAASLAESSTVSGVGIMIVPMMLAMQRNSILIPRTRLTLLGTVGVIILCLVAAIGTFARTAIVSIGVTAIAMFLRSKRKILFIVAAVILGGIMFSVTSDRWTARISTVEDYTSEGSAMGRVLVWQWTLNFVQSHPFGGGFMTYLGDRIEFPATDGSPPMVSFGKAYHNIFFSILGDLGFPGLVMYLGLIGASLLAAVRARKLTLKLEEHVWCADMAQAVQVALLTICATGMFVDISISPILWYLFPISACLHQYALRVSSGQRTAGSRSFVPGPLAPAPLVPVAVASRPAPIARPGYAMPLRRTLR